MMEADKENRVEGRCPMSDTTSRREVRGTHPHSADKGPREEGAKALMEQGSHSHPAGKRSAAIDKACPALETLMTEHGLSPSETHAVRLAVAGKTAEESAGAMGISPSTVAGLRARACEKLGVKGVFGLRKLAESLEMETATEAGDSSILAEQGLAGVMAIRGLPGLLFVAGSVTGLPALAMAALGTPDMTVLTVLVVLAAVLLFSGQVLFLHQAQTARRACVARMEATRDFDRLARIFLERKGVSGTAADVLLRIARGQDRTRIERELLAARGTVNAARARGYRSLGVHSRLELAQELLRGAENLATEELEVRSDAAPHESPAQGFDPRETDRIIEAARGMGAAQGGIGIALMFILVLTILVHWLSDGAIR